MKKTAAFINSMVVPIFILFLHSCQQPARQKLQSGEGFIPVDGGKVWMK